MILWSGMSSRQIRGTVESRQQGYDMRPDKVMKIIIVCFKTFRYQLLGPILPGI